MDDQFDDVPRRALWRSAVTLLFTAAEVVDLPCLGRDLNDKAANLESFSRETCGFHHEKYGKMERQWPGCWNSVSIFLLKICSGGDFKEKKWRDQPYSLLWQKPWLINFTNQTSKQHRSRADLAKIAAGHPGAALQACEKSGQWQMALTLLEDTEVQLRSGSRKFHRPSSANIPFTCAEPWLLKIQTD